MNTDKSSTCFWRCANCGSEYAVTVSDRGEWVVARSEGGHVVDSHPYLVAARLPLCHDPNCANTFLVIDQEHLEILVYDNLRIPLRMTSIPMFVYPSVSAVIAHSMVWTGRGPN